jgi:hypothetical protein
MAAGGETLEVDFIGVRSCFGSWLTSAVVAVAETLRDRVVDTWSVRLFGGKSSLADGLIAGVLAGSVFVVHPVSYVFHHPYWLDEAWVALAAKGPMSRIVRLASSTPVGWLLLARWIPGRGEQGRIVSLLFSVGVVIGAYVFARSLPWKSAVFARVAGIATGGVALIAPISLLRNDLKQYTADAFCALVVLGLACRVEATRRRRNVVQLAVGSVIAMLFSTTSVFVVVAVFTSLTIIAFASRDRDRIRDMLVTASAVAAAIACYFAVVIIPNDIGSLREFWKGHYLSPVPTQAAASTFYRLHALSPVLAMPALLLVALVVVGCGVLVHLGRPATALTIPVLWVEMVVVAVAKRYPFLEARTSHFLLIVSLTTATIGFVGVLAALASFRRVFAASVALVAAAGYVYGAEPYIRAHSIKNEDVRSQVEYIAHHRQAGDVIVVNFPGSYGFSYYWSGGHTDYMKDPTVSMGFITRVANLDRVVYANGFTTADTTKAMRRALRLADAQTTSRIWIVRSHLAVLETATRLDERDAWNASFLALNLQPVALHVGPEPLLLVQP